MQTKIMACCIGCALAGLLGWTIYEVHVQDAKIQKINIGLRHECASVGRVPYYLTDFTEVKSGDEMQVTMLAKPLNAAAAWSCECKRLRALGYEQSASTMTVAASSSRHTSFVVYSSSFKSIQD